MTPAFLQLVVRHAASGVAATSSDADLVRTLAAERKAGRDGERPFAELVRRHGPMVWAACRQLLPDATDAEDAFQAVFLALLRSAGTVRNPASVGGWLHGVAVNVATKVKRSAVRRRQREQKAARAEAETAVPDGSWDALLAAVHEEINRLPAALRTAFVMCDLEGVRQPDAAARLGWKPGTLTGRLARARQMLLQKLLGRGVAPAGVVVTVAFGARAAAVPTPLIDSAVSLTAIGGAVPSAVLKLVKGATPMMVSRTKLLAAALLVAGGLALGFGSAVMPLVQAQPTPTPPTAGGSTGGRPDPQPGFDPFLNRTGFPRTETAPDAGPGQPGTGLPGPGGTAPMAVARRTHHLYVGKSKSAVEFARIMDETTESGWDFVAMATFDSAELRTAAKERPDVFRNIGPTTTDVAVFKVRRTPEPPVVTPTPPRPGPGTPNGFAPNPGTSWGPPTPFPGPGTAPTPDPAPRRGPTPSVRPGTVTPAPGGNRPVGEPPADPERGGVDQLVVNLNNANARDVQKVLREHFEKKGSSAFVAIIPDANRVIVSGDANDVADAKKLIGDIDGATLVPPTPATSSRPASTASRPTSVYTPPPLPSATTETIVVIRLSRASAADISVVLQNVFAKEAPKITADERSNALIVRADADTIKQIEDLLKKLDADGPDVTPPVPKAKR